MEKKIGFWLIAVVATLVGLYPAIYFFIERRFGLLETKPADLLADALWNTAFYTHIVLGGVALLVGWTQFLSHFRKQRPAIHRQVGKVYVTTVLMSGTAGLYIALHATGGLVPALGFLFLGTIWLFTTISAFSAIRKGAIQAHRVMMIYSYATCLSAVTLRIYLPLLDAVFGSFLVAYSIAAWLCWIPNLIVAFFIVKQKKRFVPQPQTRIRLVKEQKVKRNNGRG